MVATLTDDFNRADGPLEGTGPGTTWTGAGLSIASSRVTTTNTSGTIIVGIGTLDSSDNQASMLVASRGGSGSVGVLCRVADASNYYAARVGEVGELALFRCVAGKITVLLDKITTVADGSRIGVRAEGSTISALVDGIVVTSVTDTSLATGTAAGMRIIAAVTKPTVDDFSASVLTATVTAPTVNAGADATVDVGTSFTRTATENDGGGTITSRQWKLASAPSGVTTGAVGDTATLTYTPTKAGTYGFTYSASNSAGTGSDDLTLSAGSTGPSSDAHLTGSGTLSASTTQGVIADVVLNSSGTLTSTSQPGATVTARLTGSSRLTATATHALTVNAALGGSSGLTAFTEINGQTLPGYLDAEGTLTAVASPGSTARANITGGGTLTATTAPGISVTANLSARATLTARVVEWRDVDIHIGPWRERAVSAVYRE